MSHPLPSLKNKHFSTMKYKGLKTKLHKQILRFRSVTPAIQVPPFWLTIFSSNHCFNLHCKETPDYSLHKTTSLPWSSLSQINQIPPDFLEPMRESRAVDCCYICWVCWELKQDLQFIHPIIIQSKTQIINITYNIGIPMRGGSFKTLFLDPKARAHKWSGE